LTVVGIKAGNFFHLKKNIFVGGEVAVRFSWG